MLFEVRFLIALLRSPGGWTWTAVAVGQLFRALELQPVSEEQFTDRRKYRAASGAVCVVYTDPATREPSRLEFLLDVPQGLSTAEGRRLYVEGCAAMFRGFLGEPAFEGGAGDPGFPAASVAAYRVHWVEPNARLALESRPSSTDPDSAVALIIEKAA